MGQQGFGFGGRAVQTVAQEPGGIAVKEAQGRFHQMCHALLADVGRRAEGGQMRAHQGAEIDEDTGQGKAEGHPAVPGDARRLRPVGGYGDQIPGHKPDADVRKHPQHHGHGRQAQPQEGEPLVPARIPQQHLQVIWFLFRHFISLLFLFSSRPEVRQTSTDSILTVSIG